jgi:hypothetical protein
LKLWDVFNEWFFVWFEFYSIDSLNYLIRLFSLYGR